MGHPVQKIIPIGGIDFDSADTEISSKEGDFRFAVNLRNSWSYEGTEKVLSPIKGNIQVPFDLGTVRHQDIGSINDEEDSSVYYMLWAADNNHKILHYTPHNTSVANPYGTIQLIATFDWGWLQNTLITSIDIVNGKQGKMMYWVDNVKGRKINLTKADLTNKYKSWITYLPKSFSFYQAFFFFNIIDIVTGATIHTLTIDSNAQTFTTNAELLAFFASAINADPTTSQYVTAEACDCKLNIVEKWVNKVNILFFGTQILTIPDNWYGATLTDRITDECKYPPILSPLNTFDIDATKPFNNIKNQIFQFRLQYFYDDFEPSALGPISQVPINETVNDGLQIQSYNLLHIDFNDTQLVPNLGLIRKVAVLAKSNANGNVGKWKQVALLDICDFYDYANGQRIGNYDFYNNTIANVIDDALANKEYDDVPIHNDSQVFTSNHMVKAGITENYDPVECVDIAVSHTFQDGNETFFNVTGDISIFHLPPPSVSHGAVFTPIDPDDQRGVIWKVPPQDPSSPKIYEQYPQWGGIPPAYLQGGSNPARLPDPSKNLNQLLPLGGFLSYIAGTDNWTVSKQIITEGSNPTDTPISSLAFDNVYQNVLEATNTQTIATYFNNPGTDGNNVTHRFSFRLKPGDYICRLASHWVSFGDVLDKGPMYDLNNGREYQTTSTFVYTIDDATTGRSNIFDVKEIRFTVTNSDIYIGRFNVEDCRSFYPEDDVQRPINDFETLNCSTSGYLVDASTTGVNPSTLSGAPRVEGQGIYLAGFGTNPIQFYPGFIPSPSPTPATRTAPVIAYPTCSVTDHNGFFYTSWNWYFQDLSGNNSNNNIIEPYIQSQFIWQFANNLTNLVAGGPNNVFLPTNGYVGYFSNIYDSQENRPYISESILKDLVNGTLTPARSNVFAQSRGFGAVQSSFDGGTNRNFQRPAPNDAIQLLVYVSGTSVIPNESTYIEGQLEDSNGLGISGGIVLYGQTGRFVTTNINGDFSMLVYARATGFLGASGQFQTAHLPVTPEIITQDIYCYYNGTNENMNNNPQPVPAIFFPPNNLSTPYQLTNPFSLLSNYAPFGKGLKRGGVYQVGYREYDVAGRVNTVMTNQSCIFTIPFITEDLHNYYPDVYPVGTFKYGRPTTTVTLNFKPSKFAVAYQVFLTLNQYETDYLVWVANQITYVSNIGYSTAENIGASTTLTTTSTAGSVTSSTAVTTPAATYTPPVVSSYQAGDATNIYISMKNLADFQLSNPDSVLVYNYKAGDRVRLIADENGNKYNKLYELEVTGYDTVLQSIIVRNNGTAPQLKTGVLFEVLHPRLSTESDEQIYYEVGESFLCTNPNQDNNDFSVNPIVLTCGDTYWRRRQYLVNDSTDFIFSSTSYLIEDSGLSDFFASKSWDIGRPGLADPYFVQEYKPTLLRLSDVFVTGTLLNGLSSYEALNDKSDIDISNGSIIRMQVIGQVLLLVCQNKNIAVYLGAILAADSGNLGLLQVTQNFFGNTRPFEAQYGCQNPESIRRWQGYVYGWDANRGIAWRYSTNGFFEVSNYNAKSFFNRYRGVPIWAAPAVFDTAYQEYILSIYKGAIAYQIPNTITAPFLGGGFEIQMQLSLGNLGIADGDIVVISGKNPTGEIISLTGYARAATVGSALMLVSGAGSNPSLTNVKVEYKDKNGTTISFSEPKNKWCTTYSYLPDYYGNFDKEMISFSNGQLYIHDKDDSSAGWNRFYGVKYPSSITVVFNTVVSEIKFWLSMTIQNFQTDKKSAWFAPNITNANGQKSRILNNIFKRLEQYFSASFKRDLNTPNIANPIVSGNILRSNTLTVTLENPADEQFALVDVEVAYQISQSTQK